jgi:hypothetical protein
MLRYANKLSKHIKLSLYEKMFTPSISMISYNDIAVWLNLPGDDPNDIATLGRSLKVVHTQANLEAILKSIVHH